MYRSCRGRANLVRYPAKSSSNVLVDEQRQAFCELRGVVVSCPHVCWLSGSPGLGSSSPLSRSPSSLSLR